MGPGQYINGVQTWKKFAQSVFGGQSRTWNDRHHEFPNLPKKGRAYCIYSFDFWNFVTTLWTITYKQGLLLFFFFNFLSNFSIFVPFTFSLYQVCVRQASHIRHIYQFSEGKGFRDKYMLQTACLCLHAIAHVIFNYLKNSYCLLKTLDEI